MKRKKGIAICLAVVLTIGVLAGGIIGYKEYQAKKLVAEVYPISYVSAYYWGDENSSSGMVTNDSSQEVYLSDYATIQEIYVKKGDTVEIGDPLIAFDTSEVEIQQKRQKLNISSIENEIALGKHELEKLKNTKPVDKTKPVVTTSPAPVQTEETSVPTENETQMPETTVTGAYHIVTTDTTPSNAEQNPDGSSEHPYEFLCSSEAVVSGNYLNTLIAQKTMAVFTIREGDVASGQIIASWTVNGAYLNTSFSDDVKYSILTHEPKEEIPDENPIEDTTEQEEEWVEPEGYTAEELAAAIVEAEAKLKTLDIRKRKAELELEQLEKTTEEGILYATVAGTVKTLKDVDTAEDDGTAFLVVAGSEGLYVTGAVSELLLGEVGVGTVVTANSWESGMTFEAVITEVSDCPTESNSYYGEGNSNCSYYPYTAYIEDTTGLTNGEYLDLTITTGGDEGNSIFIEKAYVRTEDGKSYVMAANEENKLEKRYVTTGRTLSNYAIEIKSGLTQEDRIAFPYGKKAVEGVKVVDAEENYYY